MLPGWSLTPGPSDLASVLASATKPSLDFNFIFKNSRASTTCLGFKLTPVFYRAEQPGCRGWGKRVAVHRTPQNSTKAVAAAAACSERAVGSFLSVPPSRPHLHGWQMLPPTQAHMTRAACIGWGWASLGSAFSPASQDTRGQSLTDRLLPLLSPAAGPLCRSLQCPVIQKKISDPLPLSPAHEADGGAK